MSSSSTKPFTKSSKYLSFCVERYIPKPSQHPTNNKWIVISTYYLENKTTPGIYKYNMETNKSQMIYKYNYTFDPYNHGQFIDVSNNTLILYVNE
eukprot:355677_1